MAASWVDQSDSNMAEAKVDQMVDSTVIVSVDGMENLKVEEMVEKLVVLLDLMMVS